jgi:hypothetical protein
MFGGARASWQNELAVCTGAHRSSYAESPIGKGALTVPVSQGSPTLCGRLPNLL